MNNPVIKEWKRIKQDLLDGLDMAINRENVDVDTLKIMREVLIYSKLKENKDRSSIEEIEMEKKCGAT